MSSSVGYMAPRPIKVCKASDCKHNSVNRRTHFFPFPDDRERCEVWLALSGRHDLIDSSPQALIGHLLCADHFEPDQFEDADKTKLIDTAVPTIFKFSESPSSPCDEVETSSEQREISEYDPDTQEMEEEAAEARSPTEGEEELEESQEVASGAAVSAALSSQPGVRTINVTVGGQKRVLMAVPKEMYITAVQSGKLPTAKTSPNLTVNNQPAVPAVATRHYGKRKQTIKPREEVEKPVTIPPSASNIPNDSFTLPNHVKLSRLPVQKPAFVNFLSPPAEPRVFQVAPELPVQAGPVTVSTFDWSTLTPEGWQDWPVPTDVFLASTVQLKNNYLHLFPRRDRMDIETTLHLASNYKNVSSKAKAHVRARVHHFLKILQLEKAKLIAAKKTNEN